MPLAFRDRFFTPQVARAITSPSGILLAGAGAAAAIVTGIGIPVAAVVGVAAWAARVAVAIPRGEARSDHVDAYRVGDPWRKFVLDAQQAQRRFGETIGRCRPGPVRERLQSIGDRVADAVTECWRIARQGDQLDAALRALDVGSVQAELAQVQDERRRVQGNAAADAPLYRTQQAVEAQLASAQRLQAVAADARNRLRLLNAQLDEAVARSVEISLQAGDVSQLGSLTDDVENVVGELESLRSALEETSASPEVPSGTPGTTASGTA
jgi:hypothetical protein